MNLKAITNRTTGRRIRSVALLATVALVCGGGCADQDNPQGFGRAAAVAGWRAGTGPPALSARSIAARVVRESGRGKTKIQF